MIPFPIRVLQQALIEAVQSVLNAVSYQAGNSIKSMQSSSPQILYLPRIGLGTELFDLALTMLIEIM